MALSFGGLRGPQPGPEGKAGLVLTGKAAGGVSLNTTLGPFRNAEELAGAGITADYDADQGVEVFRHGAAFFEEAAGRELYLYLVADSVSLAQMLDPAEGHGPQLLADTEGALRLLGAARMPPAGYSPTITEGLDPDSLAAIAQGQALVSQEIAAGRGFHLLVDGRDYQGSAASLRDLRGENAPGVSVVLGSDQPGSRSAMVGRMLGRLACLGPHQHLGAAAAGPMQHQRGYFSDGRSVMNMPAAERQPLTTKGYLWAFPKEGLSGLYPTSEAVAATAHGLGAERVKAEFRRAAQSLYEKQLKERLQALADTDKLPRALAEGFRDQLEQHLRNELMAKGWAADVSVGLDPEQVFGGGQPLNVSLSLSLRGRWQSFSLGLS